MCYIVNGEEGGLLRVGGDFWKEGVTFDPPSQPKGLLPFGRKALLFARPLSHPSKARTTNHRANPNGSLSFSKFHQQVIVLLFDHPAIQQS